MQPQQPQQLPQPPLQPSPQPVEQPVESSPQSRFMVSLGFREVIMSFFVGAVIGLVVWGLFYAFEHWVFSPLMCKVASEKCLQSTTYALVAAQLIAASAGLIALVRLRLFRPLLVIIFVTIALWNVSMMFGGLPLWLAAILTGIVYSLGYALFMVLARMRSLVLAALVMLIVLILVRLSIIL